MKKNNKFIMHLLLYSIFCIHQIIPAACPGPPPTEYLEGAKQVGGNLQLSRSNAEDIVVTMMNEAKKQSDFTLHPRHLGNILETTLPNKTYRDYFERRKNPNKVLVQCTDNRFIPFTNFLIWGGCYDTHSDLEKIQLQKDDKDTKALKKILDYFDVLSEMDTIVDDEGVSAALLLLHKGYFSILQDRDVKGALYTQLQKKMKKKGSVFLQLVLAHYGDLMIEDKLDDRCKIVIQDKNYKEENNHWAVPESSPIGKAKTAIKNTLERQCDPNRYQSQLSNIEALYCPPGIAFYSIKANTLHFLAGQKAKNHAWARNQNNPYNQLREQKYFEIIKNVVDKKPELLFTETKCQQTPLQLAVQSTDAELVAYIVTEMLKRESGPEPLRRIANLKTSYKNRRPLHWLLRNAQGSEKKTQPIAPLEETIKVGLMLRLIEADPTAKGEPGYDCSPYQITLDSLSSRKKCSFLKIANITNNEQFESRNILAAEHIIMLPALKPATILKAICEKEEVNASDKIDCINTIKAAPNWSYDLILKLIPDDSKVGEYEQNFDAQRYVKSLIQEISKKWQNSPEGLRAKKANLETQKTTLEKNLRAIPKQMKEKHEELRKQGTSPSLTILLELESINRNKTRLTSNLNVVNAELGIIEQKLEALAETPTPPRTEQQQAGQETLRQRAYPMPRTQAALLMHSSRRPPGARGPQRELEAPYGPHDMPQQREETRFLAQPSRRDRDRDRERRAYRTAPLPPPSRSQRGFERQYSPRDRDRPVQQPRQETFRRRGTLPTQADLFGQQNRPHRDRPAQPSRGGRYRSSDFGSRDRDTRERQSRDRPRWRERSYYRP